MRSAPILLFCLVACGDNEGIEECTPEAPPLPAIGMYVDAYAIPLSDACVEHGLRYLPGRWFLRDPSQFFFFEYPQYEGGCTTGLRRYGNRDNDNDLTDDGFSFHTWSDGTRYIERSVQEFQGQQFIRVTAACMLPDDTLAVTYVRYDEERGERLIPGIGTRFGLADAPAEGIELVGELGAEQGAGIFGLNLVVDGNYAYVVGLRGFDVVDVSNPSAPVHVGHIDGRLNDVRIVHGASSTVAFASSEGGDDRTWIIDVTTPTAPDFVSVIDEYSHSIQTRTVGSTTELYLATYSEEIPRYDVTNPLAPVRSGAAFLPGETFSGIHDLTVYGDRIYANNTEAGLVAIDISAGIDQEVELGRTLSAYSHASWAGVVDGRELVLHGDEGMTGTPDGGAFLRVLDGDPAGGSFLTELGRYQTRPEVGIHNFEVHGTRAYIAYYQDGVRVVDLADPTNPVEVAHFNTWNPETAYGSAFEGAVGIRKVGDLIYVADDIRGLLILREL